MLVLFIASSTLLSLRCLLFQHPPCGGDLYSALLEDSRLLSDNIVPDAAVDVGETQVATAVLEGEFFVIDAAKGRLVELRGVCRHC